MNRRAFMTSVAQIAGAALLPIGLWHCSGRGSGVFALGALPYAPDALAPHISARTVDIHFNQHHRAYVAAANRLAAGTRFSRMAPLALIRAAAGSNDSRKLFNMAAQAYNHQFYWQSLHPDGGGPPKGTLKTMMDASFGSYDGFCRQVRDAARSRFGSGWVWLVRKGKGLAVISTANADTPVAHEQRPLLVIDIWEHAYYLDYQQRRLDYVDAVLAHLLNWSFAEANLAADGPA